MIVIEGARESAVSIVLPRAGSSLVVDDHDDVEVFRRHIDDVLCARNADTLQISPGEFPLRTTDRQPTAGLSGLPDSDE